jgi:uncharacterized protein YggE
MTEAAGDGARRSITVTGEGRVGAPADAARVELGVEVTALTPAEALAAAADVERAMVESARTAGVEDRRITTGWAGVDAEWEHTGGRPRLRGYTARIVVRIDVTDLASVGRIASAALDGGGQSARLHGLVPRVSDPTEPERAARERAFAAAKDKAEQFAALAGARIGRLVTLTDAKRGWQPGPGPVMAARTVSAGEPLDVRAGEHEVAVEVVATWELLD